MTLQPTDADLPLYATGQAPPYMRTVGGLKALGLEASGPVRTYVESAHGPARLFDITEASHIVKPDYAEN